MDPRQATDALLALIEEDRARRALEIEDEARRTAARLLGEARSAALERMRDAMLVERRRLRDRLSACDAAWATEARLHGQRRFRALLEETWKRLPQALAARWADPAEREAWVEHIVASARAVLPPGRWTFAYGAGWPARERESLASRLMEAGIAAQFTADDSRGPGVEVRAEGNRVDGTAAGLTADAGEVGARLLESLAEASAGEPA